MPVKCFGWASVTKNGLQNYIFPENSLGNERWKQHRFVFYGYKRNPVSRHKAEFDVSVIIIFWK